MQKRGLGGFVRASWAEVNEIVAAANAYTTKTYGPDRVFGFSPIPAMSMVSYAAGARYLSLLGGVCMSFYDWYCDLPPASPQTWGEQTDVPESADWYNSGFLDPVGIKRPADSHAGCAFLYRGPLQGAKSVVDLPGLFGGFEIRRSLGVAQQGTDAALAMAMGHVILGEFHVDRQAQILQRLRRQYTDMPLLCGWRNPRDGWCPSGWCAPRISPLRSMKPTIPTGRQWPIDEATGEIVAPNGSVGFRWGEQGKWNLEERDSKSRDSSALQAFARRGQG